MSEFMEYSKEVITDFLQTVVIVDDEAFFVKKEKVTKEEAEDLQNKFKGRISKENSKTRRNPDEKHELDAKKLSDKFAEVGLLCTTLRPNDEEIGRYEPVLKKADIVILDWKLKSEEPDGKTAKKLIKSIIQDIDGNTQKSLRNIVIYSGESNLQEKIESVKSYLHNEIGKPSASDDYLLHYDYLQIKIYAKKATQRAPQDNSILKSEEELVDAIIVDFTNQVAGLVPNMALQSLAELRKNTHKILGVFSKELDEAYLSHRLMLPHSSDAESFLVNILVSELEALLLDSNKVVNSLQIENIMKWIDENFDNDDYKRVLYNDFVICKVGKKPEGAKDFFSYANDEKTLKQGDNLLNLLKEKLTNDKNRVKELVKKLFTENLEKTECKLIKQNEMKLKEFSKKIYKPIQNSDEIENKLAVLSTLMTKYNNPTPYLTLGSIIKNGEKYFICIIPRCDSVRKSHGEHYYPFLELTENQNNFSIIVEEQDYKKFKIIDKPEKLKMIKMKKHDTDDNAPLYANEGKFIGKKESDEEIEYTWVAELKRDKSQAILNSFAAKLSRVGYNDTEYLRRAYQ